MLHIGRQRDGWGKKGLGNKVCAERNAIFNMITNGEDAMKRVIAIDSEGKAVANGAR